MEIKSDFKPDSSENKESGGRIISRRNMLSLIGFGGLFSAIGGAIVETIRYLFPRVLYEPPSKFKVGKTVDFSEDTVTFIEDKRLLIIREKNKIFAMSAICTHLGCTVTQRKDQFFCPCHGSLFDKWGNVLRGPAPRPLDRFHITETENNMLEVNTAVIVSMDYRLSV